MGVVFMVGGWVGGRGRENRLRKQGQIEGSEIGTVCWLFGFWVNALENVDKCFAAGQPKRPPAPPPPPAPFFTVTGELHVLLYTHYWLRACVRVCVGDLMLVWASTAPSKANSQGRDNE